jgi:hypothetical protein
MPINTTRCQHDVGCGLAWERFNGCCVSAMIFLLLFFFHNTALFNQPRPTFIFDFSLMFVNDFPTHIQS